MGWKQAIRRLTRTVGFEIRRYKPGQPAPQGLMELTSQIIDRYQVDLVLDVGANVGQYAVSLRNAGYEGRINSVEPVREAVEALSTLACADRLWDVHQLALGSKPERLPLNVAGDTSVSSFLHHQDWTLQRNPGAAVARTEEVAVARLDDEAARLVGAASRVLLKLDTQGYDLEVLRGAERTLERTVAIQTELSVRPIYDGMVGYLDAIAFIEELGFSPAGFFAVATDDKLRAIEVDGMFVRSF